MEESTAYGTTGISDVDFPFDSNPSGRPMRRRALRSQVSSSSIRTTAHHEIIAPTPRRHLLLQSSESNWMNISPTSTSRALSPSPGPSTRKHSPTTYTTPSSQRHLSFSSLPLTPESKLTALTPHKHSGLDHEPRQSEETSMSRRWTRWMHKQGLKDWVVPTSILAALCVKLTIGLASYSGHGTPPMFGDYEAQRHWMEITLHLPAQQWYTYDLPYWGLDYPPLSAYASWLCGLIGSWIQPSWMALDTSRGIETPGSKLFMRATVLAFDSLVYVPALLMFARTWQGTRSKRTQNVAFLTLLFQPALLLIDFGHFQYNSVMLGFTLLAMNFFATGNDVLGAVCFVCSLGFKQMALYYAPAIGSYLLAKCIYLGPVAGLRLFTHLAMITIATFIIIFLPFLPPISSLTTILDPIHRIFPFGRGLFEDKVANFWCSTNVVLKWRQWMHTGSLVRMSAALTAIGFLPVVIIIIKSAINLRDSRKDDDSDNTPPATKHDWEPYTPMLPLLPYAILTSSMSFFLFSFQVHEKTILLPLLPMTLILSGAPLDSDMFKWGVLANNVGVFSMWPLLRRDGLAVQYIATLLLWNRLVGYNPFRQREHSLVQLVSLVTYLSAFALHLLELISAPPARYPDLFAVLNVLVCTPVFVLVWLWSIKSAFQVSWTLTGIGAAHVSSQDSAIVERARLRRTSVAEMGRTSRSSSSISRPLSIGTTGGKKRPPISTTLSRPSSVTPNEEEEL